VVPGLLKTSGALRATLFLAACCYVYHGQLLSTVSVRLLIGRELTTTFSFSGASQDRRMLQNIDTQTVFGRWGLAVPCGS
jgi:hypothetical protein